MAYLGKIPQTTPSQADSAHLPPSVHTRTGLTATPGYRSAHTQRERVLWGTSLHCRVLRFRLSPSNPFLNISSPSLQSILNGHRGDLALGGVEKPTGLSRKWPHKTSARLLQSIIQESLASCEVGVVLLVVRFKSLLHQKLLLRTGNC